MGEGDWRSCRESWKVEWEKWVVERSETQRLERILDGRRSGRFIFHESG
jgi:hypothetical protein